MSKAPRALLLRRGGLGDTLLMVPVLRALARARPAHELHFAGVGEFGDVLAHFRVVARALSSESVGAAVRSAPRRLADYTLFVSDDRSIAGLASRGCDVQLFDPRPRDATPLPQQVAAQLGLDVRLPGDAELAPWRGGRGVMLAPGSGGRTKCWPREHWLLLAAAIAAAGERVVVLVGPVEAERDDPRAWPWPVRPAFVAETAVVDAAAHVQRAAAFVGNDSGTTHLAAMLGVPTLALFGPSDERVFAPLGPRASVLAAPSRQLADLAVADVVAALRAVRG